MIEIDRTLHDSFAKALQDHTAGDPMNADVKWTNLSRRQIATRMAQATPAWLIPSRHPPNDWQPFLARFAAPGFSWTAIVGDGWLLVRSAWSRVLRRARA